MKRIFQNRLSLRSADEPVNPLDGLANLSDVMLILAVGIMMALVIHWNVDIGAMAHLPDETVYVDSAIILEGSSLEEVHSSEIQIDQGEMDRLGTIFFDEATGRFYIIVD